MKPLIKRILRVALVALCAVNSSGLNCGGGGSQGVPVVLKNCEVLPHTDWPSHANMSVTKPAECPIMIPAANYDVFFGETGTFAGTTLGDNPQVTFYNADDQFVGATIFFHAKKYPSPNDRDTLLVSGKYPGATAGFSGSRTDRAVNDIEISGYRRLATAYLPYQQGRPVTVTGPSEALPYEIISLNANLHVANAVPPLSWSWQRNGSQIGTQEALTWSGPMSGAEDFSVTISDGDGSQWTRTHRVERALISGPRRIRPGATCTWQAIPFEGSAPYTYRWENHGFYVGDQEYYTGSKDPGLGGSFGIRLVVTDATALVKEQTITVYEDSTAPICQN